MGKYFFVSGNAERRLIGAFLENLLLGRKRDDKPALLIGPDDGLFAAGASVKKMKDRALRAFDYYPDLEIAFLPLSKTKELPAGGKIRESRLIEENFSDIFLYHGFNPKAVPLVALADYVLLLVKKDVYCTGYLYTLAKALKEKDILKKIIVVHSEVGRLEDAASAFASLREELGGMLGQKPDVHFGGFFPVDAAYLAHASRKGLPCVKVFPESAFHGVIKYINRSLSGLETYFHEQPFLCGLSALPRESPV
ncbi:MAG: hypothetical protein JXD23_06310 [Spirochaetales bacterium]|nr:hypothetical protein [Spirochaetales bacterium]